jgi:hypothetical protein
MPAYVWFLPPDHTFLRQRWVGDALLENVARSNSELGRVFDCDRKFVGRIRGELEKAGMIPRFRGTAGRPRKAAGTR